jgi:hypothetical protein
MRALNSNPNVDNSDLANYPPGRIKDNDGSGNGTAVNERVYGDLHQTIAKLMRLYGIIPNDLPDNETNGFQIVDALIALASKNDYILPLSVDAGVIQVGVKLASMKDNESIVCKSGFNYSTETQIKGNDNSTFTATVSGNFQSGNYVRLVKKNTGVNLIRLADQISLDNMVSLLLYLKKATQMQENAGAIDTVATTPLTNLVAFIRRVNGADSATYLATALQNGIYPKEHFAIVAGIGAPLLKNVGSFSGLNTGGGTVGGGLAVSGNITQATIINASNNFSVIRCTMQNAMPNTNYEVQLSVESQTDLGPDTTNNQIVFKPISTTQFDVAIRETGNFTQSLKIHCRIIQLT